MRDDVTKASSVRPHPPSLLVVRLSALGDVIHTIPAVVALRESYDIDWVVEAPYGELVEIVARVHARPVALKRWSLANFRAAHNAVRGHDVAIDFQGLIKSALLARASGARERYGFAKEFIREKPAAWFVNRHVGVDANTHVVEWNMQLARALVADARMPQVDFRPFAVGSATSNNRVVLLPGAGRTEKQWPVEHWRELAKRIGSSALVVWGPGEHELADAIGADAAPPTNLRELARTLADANLVIGGDTGPLHLAAALGTRVIGLYGPTNPARNGPYGQVGRCVSAFGTSRSMRDITVADLMLKINAD